MRFRVVAAMGLLAVLEQGCTYSNGPVFEPYPYPKRTIPLDLVRVEVRDSRKGVAEGTFDTPIASFPGDGAETSVAVAPATVVEMKRRLGKLIRGGNVGLVADVVITDGRAGWKASWTNETAKATVRLDVVFRRADTDAALVESWGEAWGTRSSLDVTDEEPGELFQAAVLAAFDRAVANRVVVDRLSRITR